MHKRVKIRLGKFIILSICIITGVIIILKSLNENIIFFYTPTDLKSKNIYSLLRVGGIVKPGSIATQGNSNKFTLTDGTTEIDIYYQGTLPMLFREEQGIVAQGKVKSDGSFEAQEILAKHDENYIPRELATELKNKGYWKGK